jgi:hypothetical protein
VARARPAIGAFARVNDLRQRYLVRYAWIVQCQRYGIHAAAANGMGKKRLRVQKACARECSHRKHPIHRNILSLS